MRSVCLMWDIGSGGFSLRYFYCFLAKDNQPYSVEINIFFLGRTFFYRLRLASNLNGREFIIRSGKGVCVYLLTDVITYTSRSSPIYPMYFRDGTTCYSLKWEHD